MRLPSRNHSGIEENRLEPSRLEPGEPVSQESLTRAQAQLCRERAKVHALTIINESLCEELLGQEQQFQLLQSIAYYDTLTGLPNRNLLQDRFYVALANAVREQRPIAVLFLDINNFKTYNDEFGHGYGDMLLQLIAARVLSVLRASDTVCRYGGDEFVVLLSEVKDHGAAEDVAQKIHKALSMPYPNKELSARPLQTSIGFAMYPDDGSCLTELVRKADLAMYRGKNHSRSRAVTPLQQIVSAVDASEGPSCHISKPRAS